MDFCNRKNIYISISVLATVIIISIVGFTKTRISEQIHYDIEVTVKLIPVCVVDKRGVLISDLRLEEFGLWVDGKKVEIIGFETRAPLSIMGSTAKAESAAKPLRDIPKSLNRKFLFFFDFAFNSVRGIGLSKETALRFLEEKVAAEDEIAVVSYSASRGLRVHEFFSLDHERIKEIIKNVGFADILGRAEDVEQAYLEFTRSQEEGGTYIPGQDMPAVTQRDLDFVRTVSQSQIRQYVSGIKKLALALRYVPGTKHCLFFSSGAPSSLVFSTWSAGRSSPSSLIRMEYEDLLKELAASNCVAFPFDAHEYGGVEASVSGAYTLERLAKQTGGRYYGDIDSPKNLDDIQSRTEAYYVLGFPARETPGSGFHEIKVTVSRPGCRVSAQPGYFDTKPFKKMTSFERALHLVDVALSEKPLYQTPLVMPVRGYFFPFPAGSNILFLADLPMSALRDRNFKDVEIVDLIMDSRGKVVLLKGGKAEIQAGAGRNVIYWSVRRLPPGNYDCRIVIRELETGRAVVGRAKVEMADDGNPIQFYPPVFLAPVDKTMPGLGGLSFLTNSVPREDRGSGWPLESLIRSASGHSPVFGNPPESVTSLLAACPYRNRGGMSPDFQVFLSVMEDEAKAPERRADDLEQRHGTSGGIVVFKIPLDILRLGKHIGIRFEDRLTGFSYSSKIASRAISSNRSEEPVLKSSLLVLTRACSLGKIASFFAPSLIFRLRLSMGFVV